MNASHRNTLASFAALAAAAIPAAQPAAAQRVAAPGTPGDYLVHVGKRPVWALTLPQNRAADGTSRFCCVTNRDSPHGTSCYPA